MMPDRGISHGELHQGAQAISYGLAAITLATGLTLLLQESSRMSSPGWQMAFAIPGLNSTFWGTYVTLNGLAMLTALLLRRGNTLLGWACIAVAAAWLGRVLAASLALSQPDASGTAPLGMLIVAGAYFMHGALHLGWLPWLVAQWNRLAAQPRKLLRRRP